jgi:hypothetical protein
LMARLALVGIVVGLAVGSSAAASVPAPFVYTFQVTSVSLDATFTSGAATATTELHLAVLPKRKSLSWWGPKNHSNANGSVSAVIRLAGTATYSGLGACDATVSLETSRWKTPIFASLGLAHAREGPAARATVTASAGRFPLATTYPRRGGGCENGALPWWEGGYKDVPLSVLHKSSFSLTTHDSKNIEDGATLEWTVKMTVKKLAYGRLDCSHSQLC